jgi:hypothetical protein
MGILRRRGQLFRSGGRTEKKSGWDGPRTSPVSSGSRRSRRVRKLCSPRRNHADNPFRATSARAFRLPWSEQFFFQGGSLVPFRTCAKQLQLNRLRLEPPFSVDAPSHKIGLEITLSVQFDVKPQFPQAKSLGPVPF